MSAGTCLLLCLRPHHWSQGASITKASGAVCSWIEEIVSRGDQPSFLCGGRAGVCLGRTFPQGPFSGQSGRLGVLLESGPLAPLPHLVLEVLMYLRSFPVCLSVCLSIYSSLVIIYYLPIFAIIIRNSVLIAWTLESNPRFPTHKLRNFGQVL